jgi:GLPGLI family protein
MTYFKHKYLLSTLLLLAAPCSLVLAQIQPYQYKVQAIYNMTFQPDSTNRGSIQDEYMTLYIGEHQSLFASSKYFVMDSAITSEVSRGNKFGPPITFFQSYGTYITTNIFKTDSAIIFYDQAARFVPTVCTYTESKTIFNWKILNDTMSIGNIHCQKAVTEYGNREWYAWFTTDIPISDGPYKFCGLPGLIVKLTDSQGFWKFDIASIVNIDTSIKIGFNNKKPVPIKNRQTFLEQKKQDRDNRFEIYLLDN